MMASLRSERNGKMTRREREARQGEKHAQRSEGGKESPQRAITAEGSKRESAQRRARLALSVCVRWGCVASSQRSLVVCGECGKHWAAPPSWSLFKSRESALAFHSALSGPFVEDGCRRRRERAREGNDTPNIWNGSEKYSPFGPPGCTRFYTSKREENNYVQRSGSGCGRGGGCKHPRLVDRDCPVEVGVSSSSASSTTATCRLPSHTQTQLTC